MLPIVVAPDPVLRTVCEPCEVVNNRYKKLAKQMARTMYANNGCGIAAPQVGENCRLIVVDCDVESTKENPLVLVNPVLVETWGDVVSAAEGCLSCPGISVPIARHPWAKVRYYDLEGEQWEIASDGLLGRCLQHEIDHLDGKTLFESCDPLMLPMVLKAYDEAKKAGAKPGDVGEE